MRNPHLYDFVYVRGYGKSLFQVIGTNHSMIEKYPVYEIINVITLKDAEVLCPLHCEIDELYGVPFEDIEFHFPEDITWSFYTNEENGEVSDEFINYNDYNFWLKGVRWVFDVSCYDPEPEIEYLHELQQYHRGVFGDELNVFGAFSPTEVK